MTIASRPSRNDLIAKLGLNALILGGCSFFTAFVPPGFFLGIPAAAIGVILGLSAIAMAVHDGSDKFGLPIGGTVVAAISLLVQVVCLVALVRLGR